MNCQGCINKVRKVLQKIEGVYKVDTNAEEQKVIVTGIVNPSTLVQKLAKFGKHAEIWNAGDNQEQANRGKGKNNNQVQCIINDPSASENQYMIPTFGKDHWGHEWYINQDIHAKTIESEINQHLAAPLFLENVYNRTTENFTGINENPKWEESMIPMMRPASFQENVGTNYPGLGSEEWAHNLLGVSSISEYNHHMANVLGYYHDNHPSKMMQLFSYNHLPWGFNIHTQEPPTRNDVMMNTYIHQPMINQKHFQFPFSFNSY
ncbi:Heavy metal-associated domain, HMA [Sesbania bispinosa]|nr:Heavy metal-associated domain, HMA [Sesbania bispinosa]